MKKIGKWLVFLFLAFFSVCLSKAQNKNLFTISSGICPYFGADNRKIQTILGYSNNSWINPNIEFLYSKFNKKNAFIGIGVNYQNGRFGSNLYFPGRFIFNELSIPVIYQKPVWKLYNGDILFSFGIYNGIMLRYSAEWEASALWLKRETEHIPHFSKTNIIFSDLFADMGYKLATTGFGKIEISPYLKLRINGTWLNHYYQNFGGGIRVKFSIF